MPEQENRRENCHQLSPQAFQMLLNWISSRFRSMGFTLSLKSKSLPKEAVNEYIKGMGEEMGAAMGLLGIGVCIHGDLIHPPPVLKKLTLLQCTGMLEDFESVIQEDPCLMYYAGDWWTTFGPDTTAPDANLSQIFDWWVAQRGVCPKPLMLPDFTSFNLSHILAPDLKALAEALGRMKADIAADIQITREELTRLCLCIAETQLEIGRLRKKEAEAVEAEVAQISLESSHAGAAHAEANRARENLQGARKPTPSQFCRCRVKDGIQATLRLQMNEHIGFHGGGITLSLPVTLSTLWAISSVFNTMGATGGIVWEYLLKTISNSLRLRIVVVWAKVIDDGIIDAGEARVIGAHYLERSAAGRCERTTGRHTMIAAYAMLQGVTFPPMLRMEATDLVEIESSSSSSLDGGCSPSRNRGRWLRKNNAGVEEEAIWVAIKLISPFMARISARILRTSVELGSESRIVTESRVEGDTCGFVPCWKPTGSTLRVNDGLEAGDELLAINELGDATTEQLWRVFAEEHSSSDKLSASLLPERPLHRVGEREVEGSRSDWLLFVKMCFITDGDATRLNEYATGDRSRCLRAGSVWIIGMPCGRGRRTLEDLAFYRHQADCKAYLAYRTEGNQLRAERISRNAEGEASRALKRARIRERITSRLRGSGSNTRHGICGHGGRLRVRQHSTPPLPSGSSTGATVSVDALEDLLYTLMPSEATDTRSPEPPSSPGNRIAAQHSPPLAPELPPEQPPRRSHRQPRQVDDYLPEPLPAIRRVRLIVRDIPRTAANSLGSRAAIHRRNRSASEDERRGGEHEEGEAEGTRVEGKERREERPLSNLVDQESQLKKGGRCTLKNRSQAALSTWQHSGSTQKSNEEAPELVDALLDPTFKLAELKRFNALWVAEEMDKLADTKPSTLDRFK
ncbi:hypothetical protein FA13DRAFT_1711579 [Coprinellus micaceus]|uniref:Uncharacterized protein n=1 Tax=Coprinellus micaceus TaxID=71717 RepID=A0A4Y7T436_COPMI|nr:hypothetical protein FA13DRAFT_1711579 [Coprinellus micaceus]